MATLSSTPERARHLSAHVSLITSLAKAIEHITSGSAPALQLDRDAIILDLTATIELLSHQITAQAESFGAELEKLLQPMGEPS